MKKSYLSIFLLFLPGWVSAGGPSLVVNGNPLKWSTANPIVLNLDKGGLGDFTHSEAEDLVQFALDQWNTVPTAIVELSLGAELPMDLADLDAEAFSDVIGASDGTNPIILDETGTIFEELFGAQNSILGIAAPTLFSPPNGPLIKGFAMLNGENATAARLEVFKAATVHELGHFLNLDHAQINGLRPGGTVPSFEGTVNVLDTATMFPILVGSNAVPHPMATPHKDDQAALSALYPTTHAVTGFANTTATITGTVRDVDGVTFLQGVNVIARNVDDPFADAISYVSGQLESSPPSGSLPLALRGTFELQGLTPNATYRVYIEEVSSGFTEGASVGPVDPPLDLDPSNTAAFLEFYNGNNEGPLNPPDDTLEAEDLQTTAGQSISGVDIIHNGAEPAVTAVDPDSGSYLTSHAITVSGANFLDTVSLLLSGPEPTTLSPFVEVDPATLTTEVPSGVTPGVYHVIVTTLRGDSSPGGGAYTVTEPAPTVTGTDPTELENTQSQQVTVFGTHLLGAQSARLGATGLPDVDLTILQVDSAGSVVVEAPPGGLPGIYSVFVTNTTAESAAGPTLTVTTTPGQVPGDCNQDGSLDLSDGVCLLGHLFSGAPAFLPCGDGTVLDPGNLGLLNVNTGLSIDLSDAVYLLNFLFIGGPPPVQGVHCQAIVGCAEICTG